jgi:hypothetical protein
MYRGNSCFDFYDGDIKMNERIKELAKQAITVEHGVIQPRTKGTVYHFDKEKFAELIVRECASLMEWQKISPKDVGAYNSALSLAQRNIKEHFGVEE